MPRGIPNKPKAPAPKPGPETAPATASEPAEAPFPPIELYAVELVRDHWIGTERQRAPKVIEVPVKEAMRLISLGIAKPQ